MRFLHRSQFSECEEGNEVQNTNWGEETMSSIMELMLAINSWSSCFFYHKDTNTFDNYPFSAIQLQSLDANAQLPMKDENNFRFLTYDEIDHKDIMRFYVKECVDDKEIRKQLFNVLRCSNYVEPFIEKLHELNLYDEFEMACGDIYDQMFFDWAEKKGLNFKGE